MVIRQRRGRVLAALVVPVIAALAAGCGGGSDDDTSTTVSSGSSTAATASSSGQSAAKAALAKYEKAPPLGLTEKLTKPIPSGKTIDFITCAPAACLEHPNAMKEAAKVLGWNIKVITAGTSPEDLQSAMQQAVRDKPDGVVYNGLPGSVISKQIAALKAAKIPIVPIAVPDAADPPQFTPIPGDPMYGIVGDQAGAATVSELGPGSHVLVLNLPELPIFTTKFTPALEAGVKKYCPDCTTSKLDIQLASIGKDAAAKIVNYLQGHRDVNAVLTGSDNTLLGLPAALKGASLTKVKLFGVYPVAATLPYIASGQESATVLIPYAEQAWLVADAFARIFTGASPQPSVDAGTPTMVLTKDNLTSTSALPPVIPDYQAQFKAIWNK